MTTAAEIEKAIRRKHHKEAIISQISLQDLQARVENLRYQQLLYPRYDYYPKQIALLDPNDEFVLPPNARPTSNTLLRCIDLLMIRNQQYVAIEIKVSRADFKRDTLEKRRTWMRHADQFVYAVPFGLITKDEVPEGCGLWEITPLGQVVVTKAAPKNKERVPFPDEFIRRLIWRIHTLSLKS